MYNHQQQLMSSSAYTPSNYCYRISGGESGRSMVEMMGVLAVVGVVSVGGLAGYNAAMTKHRSNEIINEVQKRAYTVSAQILAGNEPNLSEFGDDRFGVTKKGLVNGFAITVSGVDKGTCKNIINTFGGNGAVRRIAKNELNYPVLSQAQCADSNSMAFLLNDDMSPTEDGMEIQEMATYDCHPGSDGQPTTIYKNGNKVGECYNGAAAALCNAEDGDYHLAADALNELCSGDTRLMYERGTDCLVRTIDGREVGLCRERCSGREVGAYASDLDALDDLCDSGYSSDYTFYTCSRCAFGCDTYYNNTNGGYRPTSSDAWKEVCRTEEFTCDYGQYVYHTSNGYIARCTNWCSGTVQAIDREEAINILCGGNYSSVLPEYVCYNSRAFQLTGSGYQDCPFGCSSTTEAYSGSMSDLCRTHYYRCYDHYVTDGDDYWSQRPIALCNSGWCDASVSTYSDSDAAARLCNGNYTTSFSWNRYTYDSYRVYNSGGYAAVFCWDGTGGYGEIYAEDVYKAARMECYGMDNYTTNVRYYSCSSTCNADEYYTSNCANWNGDTCSKYCKMVQGCYDSAAGGNYYPSSGYNVSSTMCYWHESC